MGQSKVAKYVQSAVVGMSAVVFAGSRIVPNQQENGPVLRAAVEVATSAPAPLLRAAVARHDDGTNEIAAVTRTALDAFAGEVTRLSHPQALETAFRSYFAYKTAHPNEVRKPYLYFVDYGLPSTTPRGYVFDMEQRRIVDGPFTVAHGRGSSATRTGVPTRFSNDVGSAATSLGLYKAQETYSFRGHSGGQLYTSIGLRLMGLSGTFNDRARDRGVVAHGAPYVTSSGAGRSEGCPAMEPARAERLLPKLAGGAMVFLFAPDERWLKSDPWLAGNAG